jgi:hypothetical protein
MSPSHRRPTVLFALALALAAIAAPASAHRTWMLPSATVLSGNEPWVTVDAASSNDVFYFEHNPLQIDGVRVIAPDGSAGKLENPSRGRYRSVFDVRLSQKGTYKIALVNEGMFATYRVNDETRRVRGTPETLAKEIPADARDLRVTRSTSRMELFVTSGTPSAKVLEPTGRGLELLPVTHPNDLVVGEASTFRFVLDGKPAPDVDVLVIPGGIRYRDRLEEMKLVTDASGEIRIRWAQPGMYWLNATPASQRRAEGPGGDGAGAQAGGPPRPTGPAGTIADPVQRFSYTTTLEVMAR